MSHDYTFGAWNETTQEFDVFANIRDETQESGSTIALMSTSMQAAQKIIDIFVERGLLDECLEANGKKTYPLTEKGQRLSREAKRKILEEGLQDG